MGTQMPNLPVSACVLADRERAGHATVSRVALPPPGASAVETCQGWWLAKPTCTKTHFPIGGQHRLADNVPLVSVPLPAIHV